ncbi:MAG: M15 family metallopeptidase [Thermoleophilaceae bacterium]
MRRTGVLVIALAVASALLAGAAVSEGSERDLRRAGLVELDERISLDLRYATRRNFTGRRLPGYCEARAYLLGRPARALDLADRRLRRRGLALRVYDAYRPARATRSMVRWARRTGNDHLLDGWIARRSNHNRGAAVDVTLVRERDGRPLGMGTAYDSFSRRSRTRAVRGRALRNRMRLVRALEAVGFRNYSGEWWHFDWRAGRGEPFRDIGIGCRR